MSNKKVILITGATSGIGFDAARHLAELGHSVYGTGRNPEEGGWGFEMLPMDVTDPAGVQAIIDRIEHEKGRLDVLINNAGYGIRGAVEEATDEEMRKLFDVNVFGVVRCCRAALPVFRRNSGGTIINISSIVGLIGLPWSGIYSASKFALEGLSQALRLEVAQFGVQVFLVNPGRTISKFAERAEESPPLPEYEDLRLAGRERIAEGESWAPMPDIVTEAIVEILNGEHDEHNYIVGEDSAELLDGWNELGPDAFSAEIAKAFKLPWPEQE